MLWTDWIVLTVILAGMFLVADMWMDRLFEAISQWRDNVAERRSHR